MVQQVQMTTIHTRLFVLFEPSLPSFVLGHHTLLQVDTYRAWERTRPFSWLQRLQEVVSQPTLSAL